MTLIENRPFGVLRVGDTASLERTVRAADIRSFAALAGNLNPHRVDRDLAADPQFQVLLGHAGPGLNLALTLIATDLPGPGTELLGMSLSFVSAIRIDDSVTAELRVAEISPEDRRVRLDCVVRHADGSPAIEGHIDVAAPREPLSRQFGKPPDMVLEQRPDRFEHLEQMARAAGPMGMAVVFPVDQPSLRGALESAGAGLIEPVLIGPRDRIENAAREAELDISGARLIDVRSPAEAAALAATMAAEGEVGAVMKGALHTDTLMSAIIGEKALRTDRRMSHVFAIDVPSYDRLLFVSDGAINVHPNLEELRDIVRNAIDLAHALDIARPKVALLSAVETISEKIESTILAAALCKMAERGAISGADIDGPLAMDNAVSEQAARIKGLTSVVAGHADILIVPDLVSGNILAKDLDYLGGGEVGGIVLGAAVPVALTSRADTAKERRASAALARLVAAAQERSGTEGRG